MSNDCEIIDQAALGAADSMDIDAQWIQNLQTFQHPRVRFYDWSRKSITYGYFIDPNKWIDMNAARLFGFDIARRPTGGGIIFHYNDFSYTVAIPAQHPAYSQNVLSNYHLVNRALLEAVTHLCGSFSLYEQASTGGNFTHFCMATATKYDLIYAGKKLGGSAQRKTVGGFLHQGTLFLSPPDWNEIAAILQFPEKSIEAMKASCVALLPHGTSQEEISLLRQSMKMSFTEAFTKSLHDICSA